MDARKCVIATSLTGLGLVLALVCMTAAQTPYSPTTPGRSDGSATPVPPKPSEATAQTVPYPAAPPAATGSSYPNAPPAFRGAAPTAQEPTDAKVQNVPYITAPPAVTPTDPNQRPAYSPVEPGPHKESQHSSGSPPRIGRFQALSHEGQLLLLDTTSGECWVRTGAGDWSRIALPVDPNMTPVPKIYYTSPKSAPDGPNL